MLHSPLVTVVTATFNLIKNDRVDTFKQCIESVHAQDYPNIEHLIIDGASDDGTLEYVREYEKKGWLICHSEPDTGIYNAMNKGIRLARGKYIVFLNSDDYWHDSAGVSKTVGLLELTKADFSCAPTKVVTPDGELRYYWGASLAAFYSRLTFCHQTMFTRVELMRELGGFAESQFRIIADYDFILRAIMHGAKPVYVPHCFTSFRQGGESAQPQKLMDEMNKAHQLNFAQYIGAEAANELIGGKLPCYFYQLLLSVVHPVVANELQQVVRRAGNSVYLCKDAVVTPYLQTVLMRNDSHYAASDITLRIMNILPIRKRAEKEGIVLFCMGIPFYKVVYDGNKENTLACARGVLFNCITIWRKVERNTGVLKYYFLGLPVLTMRMR